MQNPFESLEKRLSNIETLLLEIRQIPNNDKVEENYTVKETAEILKVSEQSIHNYIKKGFLPAQKVKRKYLIKRADIDGSLHDVKSLKYRRG